MQTELNKALIAYGDCDCHAVTSFLPSSITGLLRDMVFSGFTLMVC